MSGATFKTGDAIRLGRDFAAAFGNGQGWGVRYLGTAPLITWQRGEFQTEFFALESCYPSTYFVQIVETSTLD